MSANKYGGGEIEHVSEFQYLVPSLLKWFDRHRDRQAHSQCFQSIWCTEASCLSWA